MTRCRTPRRSAISCSFTALAAKNRPNKRSPRSFSIPCCELGAKTQPLEDPGQLLRVRGFSLAKESARIFDQIDGSRATSCGCLLLRPARMPCEHSATRSDTSAPLTHQPVWIGLSPSRKSRGGATLLYVVPVDSSRSCSLLVVKNHHRDRSSQHHPASQSG